MHKFILILFLALFLNGCGPQGIDQESTKAVELTVSAATSMQNVLQELKTNFEKEHPTIDIAFNFGASGALAQQVSQGAPVDLFLSASIEKFDVLVDEGLIDDKLQQNLIGNEIVLIAPKENVKQITAIEDLKTKAERISIGIPESVPAGKYAKEALESQGIWKEFYEQDRIVFAKDVRQVLTYVETGNVDAGFVYKTDAQFSDQIQIVMSVDTKYHSEIIYPIGVIKSSEHLNEAKIFYEYLLSDEAIALLEEYGFSILK